MTWPLVASTVNAVSDTKFCCGVYFAVYLKSMISFKSVLLQHDWIFKFSPTLSCWRYFPAIPCPVACCRRSHIAQMMPFFHRKNAKKVILEYSSTMLCQFGRVTLKPLFFWGLMVAMSCVLRPPFVWPLHPPGRITFIKIILRCLGKGTLFVRLHFYSDSANAPSQARSHCP